VLPREKGLSVRVTAPLGVRTARYAAKMNISEPEAREWIENAVKLHLDSALDALTARQIQRPET